MMSKQTPWIISLLFTSILPETAATVLEPRWVHFESDGISLAGHLYVPDTNSTGTAAVRRPAIVVGHPRGGVKEQTAGLYAREIAEQSGFITLAFDAAYQGESGGLPRYLEDPYQRANDVRNAVTYLSTLPIVDAENIGALGVCASGGYVPFAAQTDKRIKAVATVSAVDLGTLNAEGFGSYGGPFLPTLNGLLAEAGRQRTAEGLGSPPNQTRVVPHTPADVTSNLPVFYQEAHDYYRTPRGQAKTSPNLNLWRSVELLSTYRSYTFMQLISPRPLLMIAGGAADTLYFSEHAIEQAEEPKELYIIPNMTHIDLYDHTTQSTPKLVDFFRSHLRSSNNSISAQRRS
ncbi:Putative alpha/Beta hydrolase [Colletotrichum destructivum]|uniref:Alpha/Beta hydrolase n=1 Tax=Colletotrichum destructivum TaxID=34406 RepID=A0AAX4I811_9PEZI|nr:Putative alpha/Beta hydrolase [Colletotrichum destructivum]